jgi:hypothetical protein
LKLPPSARECFPAKWHPAGNWDAHFDTSRSFRSVDPPRYPAATYEREHVFRPAEGWAMGPLSDENIEISTARPVGIGIKRAFL